MATKRTKPAAKRQSGPALTRQRHAERGEALLSAWLPADLLEAVDAAARRQGMSRTRYVALQLMRAVTEGAIRAGER